MPVEAGPSHDWTGISPRIRVPMPGRESMLKRPRIEATRSARLSSPSPCLMRAGSKPTPESSTSKTTLVARPKQSNAGLGARTTMFDDVLECLEAAEVDVAFDRLRVPTEPISVDRYRDRRTPRRRAQARGESPQAEHLRVLVPGHGSDLREGRVELLAELVDARAIRGPIGLFRKQAEVDPDADEPLLGAVVQVALDAQPLVVAGIEQRDSGRPQLAIAGTALEVEVDHEPQRDREDQGDERGRPAVNHSGATRNIAATAMNARHAATIQRAAVRWRRETA